MELNKAQQIAKSLLNQYGLLSWNFKFDNAVRRFGLCSYTTKTISLSQHLVLLNDESQVKDTILHEIAHALVGVGHGHDKHWVRTAKSIGCDGKRCYSSNDVITPKRNYICICEKCNTSFERVRKARGDVACRSCCNKYNNGKYSKEYLLKTVAI